MLSPINCVVFVTINLLQTAKNASAASMRPPLRHNFEGEVAGQQAVVNCGAERAVAMFFDQ